jgi:hypothetical protein
MPRGKTGLSGTGGVNQDEHLDEKARLDGKKGKFVR